MPAMSGLCPVTSSTTFSIYLFSPCASTAPLPAPGTLLSPAPTRKPAAREAQCVRVPGLRNTQRCLSAPGEGPTNKRRSRLCLENIPEAAGPRAQGRRPPGSCARRLVKASPPVRVRPHERIHTEVPSPGRKLPHGLPLAKLKSQAAFSPLEVRRV